MYNINIIGSNVIGSNVTIGNGSPVIQTAGAMDTCAQLFEMLHAADRRNAELLHRLFEAQEENIRLRLALAGIDTNVLTKNG